MAYYTDLNLAFQRHPLTGDVLLANDAEAIKKSIRNLVSYNEYEAPFQPDKGGNARGLLFENFGPITTDYLRSKLLELIEKYEPRVKVDEVTVFQKPDQNRLDVTIDYTIVDLNRTESITVFVERTR